MLEHIGAPNDPGGIHFDLLLEKDHACRTWRLSNIPVLDGSCQEAVLLPDHRISWLDNPGGKLSRGRGCVKKVLEGFFCGDLPIDPKCPVDIELHSSELVGNLEIKNSLCKLSSLSFKGFSK